METDSKKIIVALDDDEPEKALRLVEKLDSRLCRVKVGKNLFTRTGRQFVENLQALHGFEVFLDLKFHDIPNTVAAAVRAAADIGVWMVNVHAAGGLTMMERAREALQRVRRPPKLIAVTVLTSMGAEELQALGVKRSLEAQVEFLARLAQQAQLDGVVCSARETELIKAACGPDFLTVTPGIRPIWSAKNDQERIVSPSEALRAGSDYLVIGRPITAAYDPLRALERINEEIHRG